MTPSIFDKVRYALYKHAALESAVERLRTAVDTLISQTSFFYKHQRAEYYGSGSPTAEKVGCDVQMNERLKEWSTFMTRLHDGQHRVIGHAESWKLELRIPDDGAGGPTQRLENEDEIKISLVLEEGEELRNSSLASIRWCHGTNRDLEVEHPPVQDATTPVCFSAILRDITDNGNEATEMATREERIQTVLGLVTWILVLWTTPWTSHLCTCILHVTLQKDEENDLNRITICRTNKDQINPRCQSFNHLGLALAELATGSLKHLGRNLQYEELKPGSKFVKDLLSDLQQKSINLRNAVKYCFDMHEKIGNRTELHPEHLETEVEKLLRPCVSIIQCYFWNRSR